MAREIDWKGDRGPLPAVEDSNRLGGAIGTVAGEAVSNEIAFMIETVLPSIVQIRVHGRGVGAGLVWDADGGVITNNHVVSHGDAAPKVLLHDGRTVEATVVRGSATLDLALLQIPAGGLSPAAVATSGDLRVGELVFAIGHPWGQRGVVTAGIVSGTGAFPARWNGREVELIRSDVLLAPGNSGGPLLNAAGQVVGINSMILGGDLSVAVPSGVVKAFIARPSGAGAYLGVEIRPVVLQAARGGPWPADTGLLIAGLVDGGPANLAGLLIGDVIVGLAGQPVPNPQSLAETLATLDPGSTAMAAIIRAGSPRQVEVRLGTKASEPAARG